MIDLRSDTLTRPDGAMRNYLINCEVGDDCYKEDQSVNRLQDKCKEIFDVEDALFVSSGTLANQIAVKAQVSEGNEIITESNYHINFFESSSTAIISRAVLNCICTEDGILTSSHIRKAIDSKPRSDLYSKPELVTIENTINYYQGKVFPLEIMKENFDFVKNNKLRIHLDGARLFNAHISSKVPLDEYARNVDTLSVCFSKGLGAPYGSMLMGDKGFIEEARIIRKQLGGGLHQIGWMTSAAEYALNNDLKNLEKDHELTKILAFEIHKIEGLEIEIDIVETNILFINVSRLSCSTDEFVIECSKKGILILKWLPGIVRIIVNKHINSKDIPKIVASFIEVSQKFSGEKLYALQ